MWGPGNEYTVLLLTTHSTVEPCLSLPDEPHPLKYFQAINQKVKTIACCIAQWAGKYIFMSMWTFVVRLLFCSTNGFGSNLRASKFQTFSGRTCPQTPSVLACLVHTCILVTQILLTPHHTECLLSTLQCIWSGWHSLYQVSHSGRSLPLHLFCAANVLPSYLCFWKKVTDFLNWEPYFHWGRTSSLKQAP